MSVSEKEPKRAATPPGRHRRLRHWLLGALLVLVLVLASALTVAWWGVFRMAEPASWPPAADAVTSAGALDATAAFLARKDVSVNDLGMQFAWTTALKVEPLPEGTTFYPRMLEDIRAARHSVHLLQFGFTPGEVGDQFAAALKDAAARGVEVRLVVDEYGSKPAGTSKAMYDELAASGVEIVVNDILPPSANGLWPDRLRAWSLNQLGHHEHRKLLIVDGAVAYTGGAGIEDHFANGAFHDLMVRLTGSMVRDLQAVFLTTFRAHGGVVAADAAALAAYFPEPQDPGDVPAAVVGTRHARDVSALQASRQLIADAQRHIDITNPYFTDDAFVDDIIAAARRGVRVRVLVAQESNSAMHSGALRHDYGRMLAAGIQIWEYPDAVVHAKVLIADDAVLFGTINLDAWALYRAYEVGVITVDAATADLFEDRLFAPDIARSRPGAVPDDARTRLGDWFADKLSYFL